MRQGVEGKLQCDPTFALLIINLLLLLLLLLLLPSQWV